ncbi:protein indeterminate-domain 12-like [Gastrolobium bilobum]|uniref:protein indeterminate-domain 12-like n=1 Tax=Gastrolobium bilobum TaxID=150636 RepID=UPI002AB2CF6F|nr:protein indeterminate-domain 12-like [Gastrolobium bilobum]
MFPAVMSNSTSLSTEEASVSCGTRIHDLCGLNHVVSTINSPQQPQKIKKKRSLPGNPDPDAEVIALSPKTLLATNRFVCEICNKGFQRDQNLQLHRRGHNLPWKLKQRNNKEVKKRAYVCPEPSCVHHNPSRALGDLTGIKKHYCRKHGEKKWKCDKCSKIYAVQSDWKAHSKTCGTREYRCDCGTLFSRKDSFITHRAFCDALAEESARISANQIATNTNPLIHSLFLLPNQQQHNFQNQIMANINTWDPSQENPNPSNLVAVSASALHNNIKYEAQNFQIPNNLSSPPPPPFLRHSNKSMITSPFGDLHVRMQPYSNAATLPHLSATALLQKASTVGAATITGPASAVSIGQQQQHSQQQSLSRVTQLSMGEFGTVTHLDSVVPNHYMNMRGLTPAAAATTITTARNLKNDHLTRDFLGLTGDAANGGGNSGAVDVSINVKDMLTFTGSVEYHHQQQQQQLQPYEHHNNSVFKSQQGFGFLGTTTAPESWGNC